VEFRTAAEADAALCVLNSSLFRWFVTVLSDCRNLNRREVLNFPLDLDSLKRAHGQRLSGLARRLSVRLRNTSEMRSMKFGGQTLEVQCIIPRHAKSVIDDIDSVLGGFLGLTAAAVDFITNHEYKYRLGADEEDAEHDALIAN
jgi:hypothetical protein